jgi:hypothetical protein
MMKYEWHSTRSHIVDILTIRTCATANKLCLRQFSNITVLIIAQNVAVRNHSFQAVKRFLYISNHIFT